MGSSSTESQAQSLLEQGASLYEFGKLYEALACWKQVLDLDPGNEIALEYLRFIEDNFQIGVDDFMAHHEVPAEPSNDSSVMDIPRSNLAENELEDLDWSDLLVESDQTSVPPPVSDGALEDEDFFADLEPGSITAQPGEEAGAWGASNEVFEVPPMDSAERTVPDQDPLSMDLSSFSRPIGSPKKEVLAEEPPRSAMSSAEILAQPSNIEGLPGWLDLSEPGDGDDVVPLLSPQKNLQQPIGIHRDLTEMSDESIEMMLDQDFQAWEEQDLVDLGMPEDGPSTEGLASLGSGEFNLSSAEPQKAPADGIFSQPFEIAIPPSLPEASSAESSLSADDSLEDWAALMMASVEILPEDDELIGESEEPILSPMPLIPSIASQKDPAFKEGSESIGLSPENSGEFSSFDLNGLLDSEGPPAVAAELAVRSEEPSFDLEEAEVDLSALSFDLSSPEMMDSPALASQGAESLEPNMAGFGEVEVTDVQPALLEPQLEDDPMELEWGEEPIASSEPALPAPDLVVPDLLAPELITPAVVGPELVEPRGLGAESADIEDAFSLSEEALELQVELPDFDLSETSLSPPILERPGSGEDLLDVESGFDAFDDPQPSSESAEEFDFGSFDFQMEPTTSEAPKVDPKPAKLEVAPSVEPSPVMQRVKLSQTPAPSPVPSDLEQLLRDGMAEIDAGRTSKSKPKPAIRRLITAPPPETDFDGLMRSARQKQQAGDFSGSLELVEQVLAGDPNHIQANHYLEENTTQLLGMYRSRLGRLNRIPKVKLRPQEIIWQSLDHRAGFVLAQVDGRTSFEDIIEIAGMGELEATRILARLVRHGVIG